MSLSRLLYCLGLLFILGVCGVRADVLKPTLRIDSAQLTQKEHGWDLSVDTDLVLGDYLESVALRGVPLYFVAEIEVVRPRWYWVDRPIFQATRTWRIQYQVLTQQWRVSIDGITIPVNHLTHALAIIRQIRGWTLSDLALDPDKHYDANLRIRLDASQLSRLFRVDALSNDEWSLASEWASVTMTQSIPLEPQAPALESEPALPSVPSQEDGGS